MDVRQLLTSADIEDAAKQLHKSRVVAVDLETTGTDAHSDTILMLVTRGENTPVFVLNMTTPTLDDKDVWTLLHVLQEKVCLAHNAVFEYQFLRQRGVEIPRWYDTMLAEGLLTSGLGDGVEDRRAPLATVVKKYCGVELDKAQQTSFVGVNPADFSPTQAQVEYAAADVLYLHDVMQAQLPKLQAEGLLRVARLEFNFLLPLGDMMLQGFKLDLARHATVLGAFVKQAQEQEQEALRVLQPLWEKALLAENAKRLHQWTIYDKRLEELLGEGRRVKKDTPEDVREKAAWVRKLRNQHAPRKDEALNLGSSQQVLAALQQVGIHLLKKEADGEKPSLDKNVVREWLDNNGNHPQAETLRVYAQYAKAQKIVSTYGETLRAKVHPKTGRVHADYNQMVNSGRLSSNNPNQQNMPPQIRACFVPEAGNILIVADAKNQEGRIAAAMSGDSNLLDVFRTGKDWHQMTAALAYPDKFPTWEDVPKDSDERKGCKNANFSSIYGGTEYTLYSRGYVQSLEIGSRLMAAVAKFAPRLNEWTAETAQLAATKGYATTISGRKRYFKLLPQPLGRDELREWRRHIGGIKRAAMNHPIQGSGADIMKQAMVLLRLPMMRLGFYPVAMVHDEIVYEGPHRNAEEAARLVAEKMEEAAACFITVLPIPGDVHLVKRWEK